MAWKTLLAYITGSVDQELLLRHAYLVTENRLLRKHISGHVRLSDGDRKTLVEVGKKLGSRRGRLIECVRRALGTIGQRGNAVAPAPVR